MLRAVVIFLSALCLSINWHSAYAEDSPKVVIVGAGAAGIAAAVELVQKGMDVTILEAENRVGGRIYTEKMGNELVDLGAQWVSGEKGNPVFEMADPLGLLDHSQPSFNTFQFFEADGKSLDIDKYLGLTETIRNFYNSSVKNENNSTFGELAKKEVEKYFTDHPDLEHKDALMRFMEEMIKNFEIADTWNDFIAEDRNWGVEGDYAMNWKDKGFSTILDIMMKKYPDPSMEIPIMQKIKMSKDVKKIDYSNPKIKIEMKDGETMEADDVIFTPSLGVLKANHESMFNPPLPEDKKKIIENMGYGDATKIFLYFENPWWNVNPKTNGFSILWCNKHYNAMKDDPDKRWQLELVGFFKPEHRKNILEMWINGKGAREVEQMPEDKLMAQIVELMQIFKEDKTVVAPTKMLRSKWHTDEHFRGCCTVRNVNTWKNNINMDDLAKPLPADKPRLWFAGESTNDKFYSSVGGAIQTGRREARNILQKYGKMNA